MSSDKDNEEKSSEEKSEKKHTRRANAPAVHQGPGVPPIGSAPVAGQPASAFVQPAQTVPDGDPRFAIKDAGTPYVVGLGHLSTNPTQHRIDQEQAEKDREANKDQDADQPQQDADAEEQKR